MSITNPKATPCRWCGLIHGPQCPTVKAIEYHADGVTVKRVEFITPRDQVHGDDGLFGRVFGPR